MQSGLKKFVLTSLVWTKRHYRTNLVLHEESRKLEKFKLRRLMDSYGEENLDHQKWDIMDILQGGSRNINYAMLVLNQPILSDPDLIKSLWNGAKLRFTVDGGTNRWLKFMEENSDETLPLPDRITGDFDSITERSKQYFKEKSVTFVETPDQNFTDFTKAIIEVVKLMKEKNLILNHVLALVTHSGRLDQIMANLETLHYSKKLLNGIPIILMSSNSITILLDGKKIHLIEVPLEYVEKSHSVGLIPLYGPTKVTTSGLKWNLDNTRTSFGELVSTSNTFSRNVVKVISEQDLVWTVQYSLIET